MVVNKTIQKLNNFNYIFRCKEKKMPGYGGYIPTDPVGCTYDPYFDRYYKPTTLQTYKYELHFDFYNHIIIWCFISSIDLFFIVLDLFHYKLITKLKGGIVTNTLYFMFLLFAPFRLEV